MRTTLQIFTTHKGCFVCDCEIKHGVDVLRIYKPRDAVMLHVHLECAIAIIVLCLRSIDQVLSEKAQLPKEIREMIMSRVRSLYLRSLHNMVNRFRNSSCN